MFNQCNFAACFLESEQQSMPRRDLVCGTCEMSHKSLVIRDKSETSYSGENLLADGFKILIMDFLLTNFLFSCAPVSLLSFAVGDRLSLLPLALRPAECIRVYYTWLAKKEITLKVAHRHTQFERQRFVSFERKESTQMPFANPLDMCTRQSASVIHTSVRDFQASTHSNRRVAFARHTVSRNQLNQHHRTSRPEVDVTCCDRLRSVVSLVLSCFSCYHLSSQFLPQKNLIESTSRDKKIHSLDVCESLPKTFFGARKFSTWRSQEELWLGKTSCESDKLD